MSETIEQLLGQAAALQKQGRRADAIVALQQVLAMQPDSSEVWYELGYLLKAETRFDDALAAYGEAITRGIRRAEEVHLNRGVIFSDHLRRDDDAEVELVAALAIAPGYVPALLNLGNLHEERGRRDDALACYARVLAQSLDRTHEHHDLSLEALARTANLEAPGSIDDPRLLQLQAAAGSAGQSAHMVRANVQFALGRAYDRLGAYDRAFDAFAKGNRSLLRLAGRTYNRARWEQVNTAIIDTFASAVPATHDDDAGNAEPLFICGMFRSGSTLVEQVLAAHPQVTPGGELDVLRRLATERLAPFPSSMAVVDAARDRALAAEYRAHVARLFPQGAEGRYISDKRPDNFLLIGLIKRLFPRAKIIHSVRDPLDNGLSVFMQHLNPHVAAYSCDLGDIGHYYGQYRRLMMHWKALYPESIFDFDYDAFVRDPDASLRRLFAFLGIDWDDRALRFHELDNTVKTASYWQVREPLHTGASGRWRRYATQLAPMREALLAAGLDPAELA